MVQNWAKGDDSSKQNMLHLEISPWAPAPGKRSGHLGSELHHSVRGKSPSPALRLRQHSPVHINPLPAGLMLPSPCPPHRALQPVTLAAAEALKYHRNTVFEKENDTRNLFKTQATSCSVRGVPWHAEVWKMNY